MYSIKRRRSQGCDEWFSRNACNKDSAFIIVSFLIWHHKDNDYPTEFKAVETNRKVQPLLMLFPGWCGFDSRLFTTKRTLTYWYKTRTHRKAWGNKCNNRVPCEADEVLSGWARLSAKPTLRRMRLDIRRVCNSPFGDTSIWLRSRQRGVHSPWSKVKAERGKVRANWFSVFRFQFSVLFVSVHTGTRKGTMHRRHNVFFILWLVISFFSLPSVLPLRWRPKRA